MMLSVLNRGLEDYFKTLDFQERLFDELVAKRRAGESIEEEYIILVEHPHVYTLGRHADSDNLLINTGWLSENGIPCVNIKRGGDITYHGPGQVVAYPIIDLLSRHIGVRDYVYLLEQAVIDTLAECDIESGRVEGATGVWIGAGTKSERKICAIGIRCSRYITMHGLALNVNTDLSYFNLINPCGFKDKGVTSIAAELGCEVDFKEVKGRLAENLLKLL